MGEPDTASLHGSSSSASDESFVRDSLALLERDFRLYALTTLSAWMRCGIVRPVLFGAVAALQRPSWGHWNGLIQALRKARIDVLRNGTSDEQDRLSAEPLLSLLEAYEDPVQPYLVPAVIALLECLDREPVRRRPRLREFFEAPIALRNRIAHDMPGEAAFWSRARSALLVLLQAIEAHGYPVLLDGPGDEPWLITEEGRRWSFHGTDKRQIPHYVDEVGENRAWPGKAGPLADAFRALLGKQGLRETDLRRLVSSAAPEELKGVILDDFLVSAPVGEGGFAVVHRGRQLSTGRTVAVKVLRESLSAEARVRFQAEAAYLSRFSHRSIVGVIGFGEAAWSIPPDISLNDDPWFERFRAGGPVRAYIALEWVDGETLEAKFRGREALGYVEVLAWFEAAAEALSVVHSAGLVHRDVKPSNLMVTRGGELKLMDFGIARSVSDARTLETATGQLLGTLPYMAPEQLRGATASGFGARSDIYSLAATFYELFTRTRLFDHDLVTAEVVVHRKLSGEPVESARHRARRLPWEVEALLMGGLQHEPGDRPRSAEDLFVDLRRIRRNEPILYRRPSVPRRGLLWYRRNRRLTNIIAPVVLSALTLGVADETRVRRALTSAESALAGEKQARLDEQQQRKRAEDMVVSMLAESGRQALESGESIRAMTFLSDAYRRDRTHPTVRMLLGEAGRTSRLIARLEGHEASITRLSFSSDGARLVTASDDATARVWDARSGGTLTVLRGHEGGVTSACFSPDGTRIATTSNDHTLRLWESRTGRSLVSIANEDGSAFAVFSPDGNYVVTLNGESGRNWENPGEARVWDARSGKLVTSLRGHESLLESASFSPDGAVLLTTGHDLTARTWDSMTGKQLSVIPGGVGSAFFSPDGRRILAYGSTTGARVWDAATGRMLAELPDDEGTVWEARFGSDDAEVIVVSRQGAARVWDTRTGRLTDKLPGVAGQTLWSLSEAGSIMFWLGDNRARVRRVDSGADIRLEGGHIDRMFASAVSSSARLLATAGNDPWACVWDVESRAESVTLGRHNRVTSARFNLDGTQVVTGGADATARIWDTKTSAALLTLSLDKEANNRASFSPDGSRILTVGEFTPSEVGPVPEDLFALPARVWDSRTGKLLAEHKHESRIVSASFSHDGKRVVTAALFGRTEVWDASTGQVLASIDLPHEMISMARLSPDDRWGVTVGGTRGIVWDPRSGKVTASLVGHTGPVSSASFSRDGKRIVTASKDGSARVWDAADGRLLFKVLGPRQGVVEASFSGDDSRLLTVGGDQTASVWRAEDGSPIATIGVSGGGIHQLEAVFSPNGAWVLTTGAGEGPRVWDAATGRLLRALGAEEGDGWTAAFSADSGRIVATSRNGDVRIWDVAPDSRTPEEVEAFVRRVSPWRLVNGQLSSLR